MKFLHISTGDYRGAFSGAHRLHRNLIECGHESYMLVGDKQTTDPLVFAPVRSIQFIWRLFVKITNQLIKIACGRDKQKHHSISLNFGIFPFAYLIGKLPFFKPDLIVVYFTSGFLSPNQLAAIERHFRAPVAIYLMDMEMLTGGCHYAWNCTGYLDNCSNCPAAQSKLLKNWIKNKWLERKTCFDQISPSIVAGSGWLYMQSSNSTICRDLNRTKILMGIDSSVFSPKDKSTLRSKLGVAEDSIVMYFGAQDLEDPRKGFKYLKKALELLFQNLSIDERQKVLLFTVGKLNPNLNGLLPFYHVHLPYINDPILFSSTYAAADIFICSSIEDSGPMMINESIMSGTPVAAFEMGVAVDLVINNETGFKVPLADSPALATALTSFVRLPTSEKSRMSYACRSLGLEKSSVVGQVMAFEALARRLNE